MSFSLPDTIASSQDLMALILDVKEYARWFAHESIKKQVHVAASNHALSLSPVAVEVIRTWGTSQPLTTVRLDELLQTLEAYQKQAPSMTVTLAAPASRKLKTTIVAWCRQHITPTMLVTFDFNATILGGMVVRSGSHIYDWSIRRAILDNKASLPEVLRRV
ncbi:F0F1 ATP synthase subunit delta [Candidatus Saccharibacteria bacterium]|nr:F0F1 ATP synthase subunit delta [Candidatus Saccharibacteria bacterium]